jgi:hypothetical protein
MVLTRSHRIFLIALSLVLAVGLSYFSLRAALASHYANQGTLEGYEKATRLEPSNPENWRRLGDFWEHDLQRADPQRAAERPNTVGRPSRKRRNFGLI